jgi:alkylhydroperoxidase/carboxymuconolactone decarboxylase family protein YurZ
VIQNVAVANKHIHSPAMGPYILADAEPVSERDDVEATLESIRFAAGRGVYNACDHYFLYLMQRLSPMQVLEHLLELAIPKNQLDDHYFLFPVFTWRALEYLGWEYAKYIGRAPVRYVTRPTMPASLDDVDALIGTFGLLERELRAATGADETGAITTLADEIGRCQKLSEVPGMLARALADGLSLEGAGEALSVGGSTLFLRSQTGNPMDVHINTGANTRRYLLRQPELSLRTKLRALLVWHTGPEVMMAQRMLAPGVQPDPARVAALSPRTQDALLGRGQGGGGARAALRQPRIRGGAADHAARHHRLPRQLHRDACPQASPGHLRGVPRDAALPALAPPGGRGAGGGDLTRPDSGRLGARGRGDALLTREVLMAQATLPPWIQTLRQRDPEFVDSYMAQRERILRDGAIPAKYKHLMTMIVDALLSHPDGVATIANRARAAGASEAEIQEAVEVAYLFGGTPALVTAVNAFRQS